jgi:hypothetical protein
VGTTFICVLSGELCNSVTDLAPHRGVGLVGETLQQLCADGFTLGRLEGQEQICRLARGSLAGLGRLASEDDGGESSSLGYRVSMATGLWRMEHGVWSMEHERHTDVSWASSICSERPMSRTSGRCATSSFSCCSALVRCTLSGDWRPCRRLVRARWTSSGRTDMVGVDGAWYGRGPSVVRGGSVYYAGKGLEACVLAGCWCGHGLRLPGDDG